ncbi:hypothetical protein ACN27F_31300 [Solwaraspora sp. WMMB335]|uniref:hypothetical protein n=1 Tax=Solwaraspora sp. WMMB335 TaxID=3404118 RepID=UPI003B95BBBF
MTPPPSGLALRTSQDCEQMSRHVLGYQDHDFVKRWFDTLSAVVDEVAYELADFGYKATKATPDQIKDLLIGAPNRLANETIDALRALDEQYGNKLPPALEEAFKETQCESSHEAEDRLTVGDVGAREVAGRARPVPVPLRSANTGGGEDPLFFYLYGTDAKAETWHGRWTGSDSFAGYPLSFTDRLPLRD